MQVWGNNLVLNQKYWWNCCKIICKGFICKTITLLGRSVESLEKNQSDDSCALSFFFTVTFRFCWWVQKNLTYMHFPLLCVCRTALMRSERWDSSSSWPGRITGCRSTLLPFWPSCAVWRPATLQMPGPWWCTAGQPTCKNLRKKKKDFHCQKYF